MLFTMCQILLEVHSSNNEVASVIKPISQRKKLRHIEVMQ